MKDAEWFVQLEDIPGLEYKSPLGSARRRLPGHDSRPTSREFSLGGKTRTSVTWQLPDGSFGSRSPAACWIGSQGPASAGPDLLQRLHEALALPGGATDYHFAILTACATIWMNRREHPGMLDDLEQLCLLDIRLVETRPDFLRVPNGGQMARVPTFGYLCRLYEREGLYEKALAIAQRGAALNQGQDDVPRLESLVHSLRAEDDS
jgi:hypothetical protein